MTLFNVLLVVELLHLLVQVGLFISLDLVKAKVNLVDTFDDLLDFSHLLIKLFEMFVDSGSLLSHALCKP
jgi:hypothetical protein